MAFIDITDPKSPLGCGTIMLPYTRTHEPLLISDEIGVEILRHTNAPVIMRRLLNLIEKTNRPEDYPETLSGMSTRREQPQDIKTRLNRLGYPVEFDFSVRHAKEYILRSSLKRETAAIVPNEVTFWYKEWGEVDSLILNPHGEKATIIGTMQKSSESTTDGLPKNMDLSGGQKIKELKLQEFDWQLHKITLPSEIESLEINNIKNFPNTWKIEKLPQLKKLRLTNVDLSKFEFKSLPKSIEILELNSSTFINNLHQLSFRENLYHLRIGRGNDLTSCDLPKLPMLRSLELPHCQNVNTTKPISFLYPKLYGLNISGCGIKHEEFLNLPKTMAFLDINDTQFPSTYKLSQLPFNQLKNIKWQNKTLSGTQMYAMVYMKRAGFSR